MNPHEAKTTEPKLEPIVIGTFIILIALVAGIAFFSDRSTRKFFESMLWVDEIHAVIDVAKDMELDLREAESALRSYIIGGDHLKRDEYLEKASACVDLHFVKLRERMDHIAPESGSVDRIESLLRTRIKLLNESQRQYESGQGLQNEVLQRGSRSMEQLVEAFQEFANQGHQLLTSRISERQKEAQTMQTAMAVSGIAGAALAAFALLLILRGLANRREAGRQMLASLREKEVLLKEIHHRVKNNLQIISSLLVLQSEKLKDSGAKEIFAECRERIQFMASVHQQLYASGNLMRIEFGKNLSDIASNLMRSHVLTGCDVTLETRVSPLKLDIDTSQALGLIATELILNSLKHGFKGRETGRIVVELLSEDPCKLVVVDNGIGLQGNAGIGRSARMGVGLVKALTRQIRGAFELVNESGGGTRATISFPLPGDLKTGATP